MIRVNKPRRAPAIPRGNGHTACEADCTAYDAGARSFHFDARLYAHESVKRILCRAQHGKCCFCESKVTHVAYGDVEHFRPKAGYCQRRNDRLTTPGYYWLAYDWANLLFCCQLCNQRYKRNLFPLIDPKARATSHHDDHSREQPLFINPAVDDPEQHIDFREGRAVPRSRKGRATIQALRLNRPELLKRRSEFTLLFCNVTDRVMGDAQLTLPTTVRRSLGAQIREYLTILDVCCQCLLSVCLSFECAP